ncbi:zinc finger protein 804B [Carettochelys insculpta]|uniref:zinc finger protein 804B n=1 Tax=Carettochelys insculpta TaxID=44489 RepID=UPI003EBA5E56
MACYLVISSRHLSNGHYRGIKGVFRGPLCKNGSPAPGYAEEKVTAKGLEDVKANFYCELCDKQYHKHQEFDNHINSYDHAHKQRLKDLKQREFARNVASKSWKDEKKQEKALKRLHQLAELRKQSECIPGSRPVFKAPRLVVEKKQPQEGIFIDNNGRITAGTKSMILREGQSLSRCALEKQQELTLSRHKPHTERLGSLGNQVSQVFSGGTNMNHRTGVSFSFSKKAHLKLESSASVFSENTEEACDCSESPNHKIKQTPEGCQSCTVLCEEAKASVTKVLNVSQGPMDITAPSNTGGKTKMLKENDKSGIKEREEIVSEQPFFSKTKTQLSNLDFPASLTETEQEGELKKTEKLLEALTLPPSQTSNLCTQQNSYKHSDTTLSDLLTEFPPQHPAQQGYARELPYHPNGVKTETDFQSSGTVNGNTEPLTGETLVNEMKPKTLPFLHVLSKDGTTALQWPMELLFFTKTAPCISYGCNPLYFDFRLSLNQKDHKQQNTSPEGCSKAPINTRADENDTSGLKENKQMSEEQNNQSLKPKKMNGSKTPNKALQKADSDTEKEINENGQKYIFHDLNENIHEVPAFFDVSQKDYEREKSVHARTPRRSLKHHLHGCERRTRRAGNESISFLPCVSGTKKHKTAKCDLSYSEEIHEIQNNCTSIQNWPGCSSDVSDSGKDSTGSFLSYKSSSQSRCLENEGCRSYTRYWRFSSSQKSPDRHSSYSDTSISSTASYRSSPSSHRSSDHSGSHWLFCCKRKNKTVERHKCKHRKHNCISSSDDADENYLFHSKSQRTKNCAQQDTIKYQRHSKYRGLCHRSKSKQSRNTHQHSGRKHSRSRRHHSSKSSPMKHSGSSGRSSSCRLSRVSSSGSFPKETVYYLNKNKEGTAGCYSTEPGKIESTHFETPDVTCQSKKFHVDPSENSAEDTTGQRTSLTAKLLLERVQSKKKQEPGHGSEGLSDNCGMLLEDHSQSHFASKFPSSVGNIPMPAKALNISKKVLRNDEINSLESSAKKDNFEASRENVSFIKGTNYDNCLFKDIIQIGIGYRGPGIKRNTSIKEQSDLLISEVQPYIQSCDPVPNDFPGAFPSNRHSVVNKAVTKEEVRDVSMNLHQVEGNLNTFCDRSMHKYAETENELEMYRKSISPPLTQQPITFSPDEIDKYRLLQLQAQQHMQKQLLAKHLKVLPATGPSAFSATPAVHSVPAQHHTAVTTIHHTLLQRFAVSTSIHPHSSHLSLTNIHPLSESHFTPISLSPLAPTIIPSHHALVTGHPVHLVSTTPIHASYLTLPSLPHTAFIPTFFTPHLNAAAATALHLNPLIHPLFQGQDLHHPCST